MLQFLKYIPLVSLGRDVEAAYKESTGKDKRPFYLSRRFIGSVIALGAGFAAVQFDVVIDSTIIDQLTNDIEKLMSVCVTLYGSVITVVGIIKRKKGA